MFAYVFKLCCVFCETVCELFGSGVCASYQVPGIALVAEWVLLTQVGKSVEKSENHNIGHTKESGL